MLFLLCPLPLSQSLSQMMRNAKKKALTVKEGKGEGGVAEEEGEEGAKTNKEGGRGGKRRPLLTRSPRILDQTPPHTTPTRSFGE